MKKLFLNFSFAILIIISNVACFQNYYKATNANGVTVIQRAKTIDSLGLKEKDFILRAGAYSYYMNAIKLSDDQKLLYCKLDSLLANHKLHLVNGRGHKMRYRKIQILMC